MTDPDVARAARQEEHARLEAEAIAKRWPDEDQRKIRRAKLHENLDAYLDTFVETRGDGWAAATKDDVNEMSNIWREIADLKFERDRDGDSVINFDVANRQHGRLVSTFVPYPPRDGRGDNEEPLQPIDQIEYIRDSLRASRFLIGSGESIFNTLDFHLGDIAKLLPPAERLCDAEDRVIASFGPDMDWKTALDEVEKFTNTYAEAREAIVRVKDAFMAVYGETSFFVAANAEIIDMLSTGRLEDARAIVYEHRKLYGVGIRDGINAYNEAHRANERRKADEARARRAAEKSGEAA